MLFYRDENEKNNTVNHTKGFLFRNNTHASCTLHSSLFYNAKNGYGALYGLLSGEMERKRAGILFPFTVVCFSDFTASYFSAFSYNKETFHIFRRKDTKREGRKKGFSAFSRFLQYSAYSVFSPLLFFSCGISRKRIYGKPYCARPYADLFRAIPLDIFKEGDPA